MKSSIMKDLNTYMSFFKLLLKLFNILNNIAPIFRGFRKRPAAWNRLNTWLVFVLLIETRDQLF